MARFRVIYLRHGAEPLYGIECMDYEGTCTLLRERFKTEAEAEINALRRNLMDAANHPENSAK